MEFNFFGKTKLLRLLKAQLNRNDLRLKDIQYSRDENFNTYKREMVVYVENDIHYEMINEFSKFETKHPLYYREVKITNNPFRIEQTKIKNIKEI